MKKIFILLVFMASTALLSAQSLKGGSWIMVSIDDLESGKSQVIDSQVKFLLQFDSDSLYSGLGCNNYSGKYLSDGVKSLTLQKTELKSKNNCLGLEPLEKQVWALYQKATRYRITGESLFIFTSDDHRLVFKKQ